MSSSANAHIIKLKEYHRPANRLTQPNTIPHTKKDVQATPRSEYKPSLEARLHDRISIMFLAYIYYEAIISRSSATSFRTQKNYHEKTIHSITHNKNKGHSPFSYNIDTRYFTLSGFLAIKSFHPPLEPK